MAKQAYKGGIIEKLGSSETEDTEGKKYHVTYPKGLADGHGGTVKYVRTIKEAKDAINSVL